MGNTKNVNGTVVAANSHPAGVKKDMTKNPETAVAGRKTMVRTGMMRILALFSFVSRAISVRPVCRLWCRF